MSERRSLQSARRGEWLAVAAWLLALGGVAWLAWHDSQPNLRHPAVRLTARTFVLFWFAGCALKLASPRKSTLARFQLMRLVWTLGLAMHLVHLLVAFGLGHGWSHTAAVRHVEEVGGYGEGIAVNYLFALVWLADVLWCWLGPASYAQRPRGIAAAIHGLLVFVTFNATVVFGPPAWRLVDAMLFTTLAVLFVRRRRNQFTAKSLSAKPDDTPTPDSARTALRS